MTDTNDELWGIARRAALRVEFLSSGKELSLYTKALYASMKWGWGMSCEKRSKKSSEEERLKKLESLCYEQNY